MRREKKERGELVGGRGWVISWAVTPDFWEISDRARRLFGDRPGAQARLMPSRNPASCGSSQAGWPNGTRPLSLASRTTLHAPTVHGAALRTGPPARADGTPAPSQRATPGPHSHAPLPTFGRAEAGHGTGLRGSRRRLRSGVPGAGIGTVLPLELSGCWGTHRR